MPNFEECYRPKNTVSLFHNEIHQLFYEVLSPPASPRLTHHNLIARLKSFVGKVSDVGVRVFIELDQTWPNFVLHHLNEKKKMRYRPN